MPVSDRKFSQQLETSKRGRITERAVPVPQFGAWNPDATDASRPVGDFAELKNMRKMRPDEVETRSGYKQWRFTNLYPSGGETGGRGGGGSSTPLRVIPLARAEYRRDEAFADVTIFMVQTVIPPAPVNGTFYNLLKALIVYPSQEGVNTGTGTASANDVSNSVTPFWQVVDICPCGADPVATAKQFGAYLVVSCVSRDMPDPLDCAMYALAPAAGDATLLKTWQPAVALGKNVSPCPMQYGFSPTITGPLLAILPVPNQTKDGHPQFVPTIDPLTNKPVTIPLQLDATYWLAGHPSFPAFPAIPTDPLWEFGTKDSPASNNPINSILHTKNRGWKYRIVVKRKFMDARNQEHYESDAPSVDFYVEPRIYIPAGIGVTVDGVLRTLGQINAGLYYLTQTPIGFFIDAALLSATVGDYKGGETPPTLFPSTGDYLNLTERFWNLYGGGVSVGDNLFFVASDFFDSNGTFSAGFTNGASPYRLDANSYEITGAPQVVFNWADFGIDPNDASAYAIDIYRTTYSLPDESKDLAAGLPYQPYNYGFVGTLYKTDTTFTDNIADANLLMAYSPLSADGFLIGEFAGEVLQSYQGSLVLGNTRTKYRLRAPWISAQAFLANMGTGTGYSAAVSPSDAAVGSFAPIPSAVFALPSASGTSIVVNTTGPHYATMWYYAYQDQNGVTSDLSPLPYWIVPMPDLSSLPDGPMIALPGAGDPNKWQAIFTLPRGYSTLITSAVIFRAAWNGTAYNLYREATVSLSSGYYASDGTVQGTFLGTIDPTGLVHGGNAIVVNADGTISAASIPALTSLMVSDDPGQTFWSSIGDAWNWPQANNENETDQDPITGMESEIGPLYIFSDRTVVMTRLNGYQEPVHTAGTGAGCLSRFGLVKVDTDLFAISSAGMTKISGSGSENFPANIFTEIWARLQERILGQPLLSGVKNLVSMSYLAKRGEIWITFPSTIVDKFGNKANGALPSRTFIIRSQMIMLEAPYNIYRQETIRFGSYEFDIAIPQPYVQPGTPGPQPALPSIGDTNISLWYAGSSPNPSGPVLHLPHADGSMWSAWYDPGDKGPDPTWNREPALVLQDNDRPELPWPGQGSLQWSSAAGAPGVAKRINGFRFNAMAYCDLYFLRGMTRTDGLKDAVGGTLRPECVARKVVIQGNPIAPNIEPMNPSYPTFQGNISEYDIPIDHSNSVEAVGTPPAVRLVTRTNAGSMHMFRMQSMHLWYDLEHYHKP